MNHTHQRATVWTTVIASSLVLACGPPSGELGESSPSVDSTSSQLLSPARAAGRVTLGHPRRFDAGAPTPHDGGAQGDAGATSDAGDPPALGASADAGSGEVSTPAGDSGPVYTGATSGLALHVAGSHLVDASNATIVLRGADVSGTEFVCAQNYTSDPYGGAPLAAPSTFAAMRAWNINVIRLPLNEDCWLDINGVEIGGAAYQAAIEAEVSAAHAAGLFVILDLHWTAPGSQRALSQNPEPDADHSPAFWTSVATTFESDPGVLFDLFNEPYSYWGTDPDPWDGWLNGDVQTQYTTGGTPYTVTSQWNTAGMQQLLTAVRATGATQPIMINGLNWANDDSGWLTHLPFDPLGQMIVGAHIYPGESCDDASCWSGVFPALGAQYPVLIGETGDSSAGPVTFLPAFLGYADSQGWSYLAWTWNPWGDSANILVTDWVGTPTAGEGVAWQHHLLAVPFQN
jgi:endoglucanase